MMPQGKILIYSQPNSKGFHAIWYETRTNKGFKNLLGRRHKAYFNTEIDAKGMLKINNEVTEQSW